MPYRLVNNHLICYMHPDPAVGSIAQIGYVKELFGRGKDLYQAVVQLSCGPGKPNIFACDALFFSETRQGAFDQAIQYHQNHLHTIEVHEDHLDLLEQAMQITSPDWEQN